tara:strand:- start:82872 stop:83483 length:612 start_codon:yes stop_codon:yes gene_type:complete
MTYVVAVTGGICSGKSTVSQYFQALGVPIIDADVISRDIVAPGTNCLNEIVSHFGSEILSDQKLNRKKLRHIIFKNKKEKVWLETLLHPAIFQEIQRQINNISGLYCIIAIPLLVESYDQYKNIVQSILVIDTPVEEQIQRLTARDQCSVADAKKIISAQSSRESRLKIADQIISNHADLASLKLTVTQLHQQYLIQAQKQTH